MLITDFFPISFDFLKSIALEYFLTGRLRFLHQGEHLTCLPLVLGPSFLPPGYVMATEWVMLDAGLRQKNSQQICRPHLIFLIFVQTARCFIVFTEAIVKV